MPRITFTPSGKQIDVPPGTLLTEACRQAGFSVPTPCGGKGMCGKCRVRVLDAPGNPAGSAEMIGVKPACLTEANADLVIADPEETQKGIILTDFAEPAQAAGTGEKNTVAKTISQKGLGLAVDLGTTTLAAALCDLETGAVLSVASRANPQSLHGDDVISRIEYASRGEAARNEMRRLIVGALQELAAEALRNAGMPGGRIHQIAVGANTAMNHLLLGVDPEPLTHSPFTPAFLHVEPFGAETLGWESSAPPLVHIVHNIASFIGGDVTAGLLAHDVVESKKTTLFLDIGTNAEIVLTANGKTYACAAAAGPAFEGARISQGMRAVPGAIARVSVKENGGLAVGTVGDAPAKGICGTGLLDAVAALLRTGMIDDTGQLRDNAPSVPLTEEVSLTQKDVREFQLAKGAIAAGVRILLDVAGIKADAIDSVLLAGGFGTYLNPESVLATGLLPQGIDAGKIRAVGNASLAGTRLYLLSDAERKRANEIVKRITYVELSGRPDFSSAFAEEMLFPTQS